MEGGEMETVTKVGEEEVAIREGREGVEEETKEDMLESW